MSPELFTEILTPHMIEGSTSVLEDPDVLAISASTALKIFGKTSGVIGKIVGLKIGDKTTAHAIGAVYQDFPTNSIFRNSIYAKFTDPWHNADQWNNGCMNVYLLLDSPEHAKAVETQITAAFKGMDGIDKGFRITLRPIRSLYFAQDAQYNYGPQGNKTTTNVLMIVAILVIIIACINFINFTIALAPARVKSIHIHKIFGSSTQNIRVMIMSETVLFCAVAGVLALSLVELASLTPLANAVTAPLSIADNLWLVGGMFALLLTIGVIAGLFPAIYLTGNTAGRGAQSIVGRMVRNILLGFQYTVSVTLVIVAIFMNLQNEYVSQKSLGFNTDNIITFRISEDMFKKNHKVLADKLKNSSAISDVAFCSDLFAASEHIGSLGRGYHDQQIYFNTMSVSANFPNFMGPYIEKGRDFTPDDELPTQKATFTLLFNAKAAAMYGITVGDSISNGPIAGITNDYHYQSLSNGIEPLSLMCFPHEKTWGALTQIYCKISGDEKTARQTIKAAVRELDPTLPIDIQPFKQTIDHMYTKEHNQTLLITLFSILSIIISLAGVLSLILLEMKARTKEVSLRKIHGATVPQILTLFNQKFMILGCICSLIAVPLAYYGIQAWLTQFVFRITPQWWVFAVGCVMVMTLTCVIVTACCWQTANQNPVKSLKTE